MNGGGVNMIKTYPFELIGKRVEVVDSTNGSLIGVQGEVTDETKSSLVIKTEKGNVTVLKSTIRGLKLESGEVITLPNKRGEERIKGK